LHRNIYVAVRQQYCCLLHGFVQSIFFVNIYAYFYSKEKTDTRPQIADLCRDIVPKYAVHWEDLGIMLGLQDHDISVISQDHIFNPNRTLDCCKSMLKKWLRTDSGATWGKLRDAINTISKQGMIKCIVTSFVS